MEKTDEKVNDDKKKGQVVLRADREQEVEGRDEVEEFLEKINKFIPSGVDTT